MKLTLFGTDLILNVGDAVAGLNQLNSPLQTFNNLALSTAGNTLGRSFAAVAMHAAPIATLARSLREAVDAYRAGLGLGGAFGAVLGGTAKAGAGLLGNVFGGAGGGAISGAISSGLGAGPTGVIGAGLSAAPALMDTFNQSLETLTATLGAGLIPVAVKAIEWVQTFTDWFAQALGPTMEKLGKLLVSVMTAAEPLLYVLGKIVEVFAWVVNKVIDLLDFLVKIVTFGMGSGPKRISTGDMSAGLGIGKGGQLMSSAQMTDRIQGQLLSMTGTQLDWLRRLTLNNELMLAVLTSMERKAGRVPMAAMGA